MEAKPLYQRYRPQRFSDLVGTGMASVILRRAVEQGKISNAYLLHGPKGTGKTTLARLLAMSLNCSNLQAGEPCGICEQCVATLADNHLDVLEIDAASNTGVGDVRERIIATASNPPAWGKYRVYILDEAHMLSKSAFNALLKTVEETKDSTVFVFCTTETEKMPATIVDRCVVLKTERPNTNAITNLLERTAKAEGYDYETPSLTLIASAAEGSYRRALVLLQVAALATDNDLQTAKTAQALGLANEQELAQFWQVLQTNDFESARTMLIEWQSQGQDLEALFDQVLTYLNRDLLEHKLEASALLAIAKYVDHHRQAKENLVTGVPPMLAWQLLLSQLSSS